MFGLHRSARPFVAAATGVATLLSVVALAAPASAATPSAPTGLSPSGSASLSGIPTLSWDRSQGATSYDVQVSASSAFTGATTTTTVNSQLVPTTQVPQGLDYWRVRAKNGSGTSGWTVESFTRTNVDAPTLLSPLGTTLKEPDNPPVLSWSPVPGATGYTVQVSTDSTFADSTAITSFTTKISSLVVLTLKVPNTYYWRVQAALGSGLTTQWADPQSYTLQGLSAPDLVGPTPSSSTTNVQDVVLDWTPVPGAATYDVQVSTDQDFLILADSATGVVGTSYSPPTTLNNDQYYWRVRPVDAANNKLDWSQVATWQFRRNWPDQPTLQYPGNAATVGDPFYYQWTPVHHASSYVVQLSTHSDFSTVDATCHTVSTTLVPSQDEGDAANCMPDALATYYWRVKAVDDPEGVQSDVISAQVRHFTYAPTMVTQESPADGASVAVPTMTWDPVAGSAKYALTYTDTSNGSTTSVTTTGLSYTPRTLLTVGHTYRWQVQTVSADGRTGASVLAGSQPTFTVVAQDPAVASRPAPTNSPTNSPRFPTLTWSPVVNATKYQLYVRPSGTTGYTQVTGTFAYPAGEDTGTSFLTPGSYDWIVEAYNGSTLLSTTASNGTFSIETMAAAANGQAGLTGNKVTGNAGTTPDTCAATLPSECQNLRQTPVLSWDPDANAGYYLLYLSFDGEMTNLVPNYSPIKVYGTMWSDTSALPDSQAGSAYYWEAVPCRTTGACAPLQHAGLAFNKLSNQIVLDPAVSNSSDTCAHPSDICNDVTLSWDDFLDTEQSASTANTALTNSAATTEAQYYRVETSTDPNFQSTIDNITVDQTTFTSFINTYPEGPVYWRVQAYDGATNPLAWSTAGTFTKSSPAPALTSPASDAIQPGTGAFTWQPQEFAKTYTLEIYRNDDLVGQSANRVTSATGLVQAAYSPISPLAASATPYTWRVRRSDAKGRTGPWSALQPFTVTGTAPTLVGPAPGADVPPSDSVFNWQAVDAATSYTFERRVLGSSTSTSVTTAALAYAPTATLAGGSWQWRVTALDAAGQTMAASGWRDFTVVDHPVADTDVSITGSGAVGTDLTVNPPAWNLPGVTTTYQWKRNGTSISGATGLLYTVTTTDVGKNLTVVATGTKDGYQAGTSTSNTIVGSAGAAPTPSVAPSISGSRQVGQVLTADHGVWPGSPKYTYQWQRNGHAITGATAATYRTQAADATTSISVRVTATSTGLLPGSATSNALTIAKNPSTTSAGLVSSTVTKGRHGKLNVVVAVPGVPKPTGTLKVFSGTTLLTTVSLRAKNAGHKAITLPLLPVGSHKIRVKYSGSSTIAKSKSSPVVLSVVK